MTPAALLSKIEAFVLELVQAEDCLQVRKLSLSDIRSGKDTFNLEASFQQADTIFELDATVRLERRFTSRKPGGACSP